MLSAGNVTLDAQGNANAVFIFQIGSTPHYPGQHPGGSCGRRPGQERLLAGRQFGDSRHELYLQRNDHGTAMQSLWIPAPACKAEHWPATPQSHWTATRLYRALTMMRILQQWPIAGHLAGPGSNSVQATQFGGIFAMSSDSHAPLGSVVVMLFDGGCGLRLALRRSRLAQEPARPEMGVVRRIFFFPSRRRCSMACFRWDCCR